MSNQLDEIRARDLRDFLSTKVYVAGSAPVECREDRRTLLALYDAQSLELQAVREALGKMLVEFADGYCFNRMDEARRALHNLQDQIKAALKQSRGAT